jgi:hypothetical protein
LYIGIERTGRKQEKLIQWYVLVAAVLASIALGYRPADAATVAGDSEVQISGGLLIRKAPIAVISMRILITDTKSGVGGRIPSSG